MKACSRPGLPLTGWTCQVIEDQGGLTAACEMCGTAIRYVHSLAHIDWSEIVRVGCVCAEKMETDHKAAKRREKQFKAVLTWKWKVSARGNRYRNLTIVGQPLNVILCEAPDSVTVRLNNRISENTFIQTFETKSAALGWLAIALEKLDTAWRTEQGEA